VCRIPLGLVLSLTLLGIVPATAAADECLWCREYLTDDLFGARTGLAEHGVVADLQLTQFYQGVASGGAEQRDACSASISSTL
jgi:hypothetical protein